MANDLSRATWRAWFDCEFTGCHMFQLVLIHSLELGLRWLHDRAARKSYWHERAEEELGCDLYPS